jgi:hypothetical protein
MQRKAQVLTSVDLPGLAQGVSVRVLLLLGSMSHGWAVEITRALEQALTSAQVVVLAGEGDGALDSVPEVVVSELMGFFDGWSPPLPARADYPPPVWN